MPSILDGLDEWIFDGVPFLGRQTATTAGRKTVTHEFVNSSRRVVEDLGKLQKVFTIQAEISNSDGNYFAKRNALINVLEKGGRRELSHAFLGRFNVVAKPYVLEERISDLGAAFFSLTFERADDDIPPLADTFTLENIAESRSDAMDALSAEFEKTPPAGFRVRQAFPFNFITVTAELANIGEQFNEVTRTFDRVQAEIDNFTELLNDFSNSINSLVNAPGQLVSSITGLFDGLVALSETPEEAFLTLEKLFESLADLPTQALITAERIERNQNTLLLTGFMQIGSLAFAYEQAGLIPFFTIREIDTFAEKLNAQFNRVFPTITDADVALTMQNLRNTTNEFLDIQRLNVKRIIDFEIQPTTAQAFTYRLYGNLDNFERLVGLNSFKDTDFITGDIETFR